MNHKGLSVVTVVVSGLLGAFLDVERVISYRSLYWLLGVIIGFTASYLLQ